MLKFSLLAAMLATGSLGLAQTASTTLPKGFDTTPGTSYFWGGFSIASSATTAFKYYVAKNVFLYDASTFPWDPTKPKVIRKMSFRRTHFTPTGNTTAHNAKWVVILSTSNQPTNRPNTKYEENHGPNKKTVFGTPAAPGTVAFLATAKPAAGKTAAFDVSVSITPFVVPANSKTLVVEIRSYSSSVASGTWYVDSALHSGTGYNGGSYSGIYNTHCMNPKIFYSTRANYLNGHFGHVWRTYRKGGLPVLGVAGTPFTTGVKIPNTTCEWWVNPLLTTVAITDNGPTHANPGAGTAYLDWGPIPNMASFIGVKISHQALFIDPTASKIGLGFTRAGTSTIGTLYDAKLVKVSGVYSYGAANVRYNKAMDPNKSTYSRYLYRRAPIINIQ